MSNQGSESNEKIYIGIMPDDDGTVSFYETYARPTANNNVFRTFAEAKAEAKAKMTERLEITIRQLVDIEVSSESSVISCRD